MLLGHSSFTGFPRLWKRNHLKHLPTLFAVLLTGFPTPLSCAEGATVPSPIFPLWKSVWAAYGSQYFRAQTSHMHDPKECINKHPWLSEELLFIQSNTRVLVCQNPTGELRYLALPTQVYLVPTGRLGYVSGMYHHFDAVHLPNPGRFGESTTNPPSSA